MDKNPEQILDDDLIHVRHEFSNKNPNIIFYSEPFLKAKFLNELINSIIEPVIFLDFDLLYSGYIISKMIQKNEKVEIYRPNKTNWGKNLSEIIKKISSEKCVVIIDSLNGLYNIFYEKESGRSINASLMLLASIGREMQSSIVVAAMARRNDNKKWILSPGGRHVIDSKKSGIYHLTRNGNNLTLSSSNYNEIQKIFRIPFSNFHILSSDQNFKQCYKI
jgi:hypothetical protein